MRVIGIVIALPRGGLNARIGKRGEPIWIEQFLHAVVERFAKRVV